ncbi:MAG: FecR domain-containing protein [Gemmatimonadaceae bacterium]
MSSSFTPIDPATIAALNAGGERALEQIFRANYAFLLERALERLKGERAAVPRLISATVRELWEERDGFHTSAEIEAFFNEEFRHRARAVRARMAAVHRFEKAEGVAVPAPPEPPTADRLWAEISTALHQPVVDPATAAKRRREHSSHEVAEHINTVARRGSWKGPVIIVAVSAVVVFTALWWISRESRAAVVNELLGSAEAEAVTTRAGLIGSATLADGSVAQLAPEARLVTVPRFGRDYRALSVSGAASFTVAPGGAHEFEARIGDITVIATGGAFAVRNYAGESYRLIRATEGDIRVRMPDRERTLRAGEALYIGRAGGAPRPPTEAESAQGFGWIDGRLDLHDVTVAEAARHLWRWYGLDVSVPDSALQARTLSISVPLGSSQAAIAAIEAGANARFSYVNQKAFFTPAPAPRGRR